MRDTDVDIDPSKELLNRMRGLDNDMVVLRHDTKTLKEEVYGPVGSAGGLKAQMASMQTQVSEILTTLSHVATNLAATNNKLDSWFRQDRSLPGWFLPSITFSLVSFVGLVAYRVLH